MRVCMDNSTSTFVMTFLVLGQENVSLFEVCFEAARNAVQQFSPHLISSDLRNSLNGIYGLPCTSHATSGSDFQQTSFLFFGSIFASIPCPSAESCLFHPYCSSAGSPAFCRCFSTCVVLSDLLYHVVVLFQMEYIYRPHVSLEYTTFSGFDKNNQLEAYFTGTRHTKKFTFNLVF